jgi:cysteine desulfurase
MNVGAEAPLSLASRRPIYLDHHATTPVDGRVAELMLRVMTEQFGNPNDRGHAYGEEAYRLMEESRASVAHLFNADPEDVVFASDATTAADGLFRRLSGRLVDRPLRVSATTVEHAGLLDSLERLERSGRCELRWIEVDGKARPDVAQIEAELKRGCDLLVVMAANNEVGTINPTNHIARLSDEHQVPIFVDASQAAAHLLLDVYESRIAYLLTSAHKMGGPKGIAALVSGTGKGILLRNLEAHRGTPNVAAMVGFAEACRISASDMTETSARIGGLRDRLERMLLDGIPGLVRNGDTDNRLPQNLHVSVPDAPNDAVVARLSRSVALSTGSACRSGTDVASHVLRAMRLPRNLIDGALRIGLGRHTTAAEIEVAGKLICAAVEDVRNAINGD